MLVGSLFSGIGGLDLGLEWAGMKVAWQSEIDPYACRVLKKHWPEVPNYGDITKINPADIAPVDLLCGGYPCQPFSSAGKRKGKEDDRHLWPEIVRLLQAWRGLGWNPTWCLFENVAGHITLGLDQVLSDLEREGYAVQPLVIPACAVGAWHRRDRVFILANSKVHRTHNETKGTKQAVASADKEPWLGYVRGDFRCGHNETPIVAGRSRNWESGRISKPCYLGRNNGFPGQMDRLERLGNAVVPQVAYEIGLAIMAAHYGPT